MRTLVLTCVISLAAVAGPVLAADPGKPRQQCFMSRDIRGHISDGDKTLYLSVNQRDTWKVTMSNNCLGAGFSTDALVFRNFTGSDSICHPLDLDVGLLSNGFASHCGVASIVKMTPAEVAALPAKLRP